jgi:prepilin peptidase CpaA
MDLRDMIWSVSLLTLLFLATVEDLRFQKIPNRITFPAMALAIVLGTAWDGLQGLLFSLEGIAVGIGALLVPYLMGGMGAGDAKLMGAVGGFLGPKGAFFAFLFTALVGGLYALILIIIHGNLKQSCARYGSMMKVLFLTRQWIYLPPGESEQKPRLRYGAAIALGTILSVLWRGDMLGWGLTRTFT